MHPVLFQIGKFEVRAYGLMIAIAALAAAWLAAREVRRRGMDPNLVYDFLFFALVGGLLGARLYYVLFSEPRWYLSHPGQILAVWNGGLSLHGGMLGGLIAGLWFTRSRRLSFWDFADAITPGIILGQAVGRFACVFNGCSYGKPSSLPWAVVFTDPKSFAPLNTPLHPTQFYELSVDFLILAAILAIRSRMRFPGQLFLIYAVGYAVARFVLEFFRGDSLLLLGQVPLPQAMSLLLFIAAVSLYLARRSASIGSVRRPAHS